MITGSILLVYVAVCLIALGVIRGEDVFYYLSIVSSALAALALIVGLRQDPALRLPDADFDVGRDGAAGRTGHLQWRRPIGRAVVRRLIPVPGPVSAGAPSDGAADPPDEPPAQLMTNTAATRLARLGAEVAVIDGRPRFHLAECLHLLGREVERLPVTEAVELGFTPCGQCEPATALLDGAPRP